MLKLKYKIFLILTFTIFILDQLFKYLARIYLVDIEYPINLIPGLIDLKLIYNTGISFGLLNHDQNIWGWLLLSAITLIIIIYLIFYLIKNINKMNYLSIISFSLIIGGALGNGFDRLIFRSVTDYMIFRFGETVFFINNFADDTISIGIILIIINEVFYKKNINKK